jgi:protein subunit release factor A
VYNKYSTQLKENIMKRVIEIRAAEGGDDSKLFVKDLAKSYIRMASKLG